MNDTADQPANEPSPCGPAAALSYLKNALQIIDDADVNLEVGRFEVHETEGLRKRDSTAPLSFQFEFRGIPFEAQVTTGDGASLCLKGDLGKLPFTAQSGTGRKFLRALVQSAGKLKSGHIALNESGEIFLETETSPPVPRTPISVMASVVALLLEIKPYLEAITDVLGVVTPPPDAAS